MFWRVIKLWVAALVLFGVGASLLAPHQDETVSVPAGTSRKMERALSDASEYIDCRVRESRLWQREHGQAGQRYLPDEAVDFVDRVCGR